ncbi:uncharacterized protein PV06_03038 [Exophiala oligosperma]|uniref:Uncharacterized protein n=1 Tax=Exophiala oligosperma TaxID=215243 RepID=A0A0D2DP31_9EURO|nr:uncharacterized protein PV06_03038 [Exophiala oligosperma]KIW44578.1 hypothetical protein PV06_03038 [Exophiala oligosperma]
METAIRFSQNSHTGTPQRFLYVDVAGKSFKLCNITKKSKKSTKYESIHTSTKVPAFRAFDWHPVNEDLVVVGQAGGEATLINIAEGHQDSLSFQVRSQRLCNAVTLSSQNLLAAGLDKVRTDFCLNVWDYNQRLPAPGTKSFSKNYSEPLHKLASGEPITSLKFFQDDPQLLVAGVKGQFVRLYDLREPSVGNGLQFATRCVHNLAIDWLDENYFASAYPTSDPSICVWDRRMISRLSTPHMSFGAGPSPGTGQPEASLELKNVVESPGTIWSLRFSKARRGHLGVLSSTGNLKVYDISKDSSDETHQSEQDNGNDVSWENSAPLDIFLDRAQEVANQCSSDPSLQNEKIRIVSFDFMTTSSKLGQPEILTLTGDGRIRISSTNPPPEPVVLANLDFLCRGDTLLEHSSLDASSCGKTIEAIRRKAQPRNLLKQTIKQTRQEKKALGVGKMSSFENQTWYSDLGYYEKDVPLRHLLSLNSSQRVRCQAGYLLNPTKNKAIVSDSNWLQSFWAWIERATRISQNGNMTQDNFDLARLGVYALWMEDINTKNRTLGPRSNKPSKIIENLVRRLNIPSIKSTKSKHPANRQLCLHSIGLAWSYEELEARTSRLVSQNQHTKAAALAMFAMDRKLAYKALRGRGSNQSHKMLAMAIAGASKKMRNGDAGATSGDDSDAQDDWAETISSLAEELTDPYARAILAFVKTGDWSHVVAEDSLPLKYRVCVALRHLDDSKLTEYILQARREALTEGDAEGIILTGIGTRDAFDLLNSYVRRFGDLQTAVLALCPAIPRYVDDDEIVRQFDSWKDAYRHMMNGWNLRFDRVRFDIACQNAAVDESGRRLIQPAKQQIRLVCGFCAQSLTHNAGTNEDTSPGHKMVETQQHPLTREKAAAIGTVCPKCGRHLPRCGVCDLWLGMPDESYLPWYGPLQARLNGNKGGVDLSASLSGSVHTTIGPATGSGSLRATSSPQPKSSPHSQVNSRRSGTTDSSTGTAVPTIQESTNETPNVPSIAVDEAATPQQELDREVQMAEQARQWDSTMAKLTVLCLKCSHGCHAAHARMWFEKHRICPVPECRCVCNE